MWDVRTGEEIGRRTQAPGAEPVGSNEGMEDLLNAGLRSVCKTRQDRFDYYAAGYSNGVWATELIEETKDVHGGMVSSAVHQGPRKIR